MNTEEALPETASRCSSETDPNIDIVTDERAESIENTPKPEAERGGPSWEVLSSRRELTKQNADVLHRKRKILEKCDLGGDSSDGGEPDFVWEDYLEETGSVAAPPTAFIHVERSLESSFKVGMKLEIQNSQTGNTYWPASVVMTCGPLLSLRYAGYGDDRSADFWCDVTSRDIHPLGWCSRNGCSPEPPAAIKKRFSDWTSLLNKELVDATSVPSSMLEGNGTTPVDQIKQGMKLEVQAVQCALHVWIATILENAGGRLFLKYDGSESPSGQFWLFYLCDRLHPVGWAPENGCSYCPPEDIAAKHTEKEWRHILEQTKEDAAKLPFPEEVLQNQNAVMPHDFALGMKLEAIHPTDRTLLQPATVVKVFNECYFLVELDDHTLELPSQVSFSCSGNSLSIFPVNWAKEHDVPFRAPKGYKPSSESQGFNWEDYLAFCKADAAPKELFPLECNNAGFKEGMKLEAANPVQPHQICVASLTRIVQPLTWIRLEHVDSACQPHIVPFNSQEIFPVGWCESNGCRLYAPRALERKRRRNAGKVGCFGQDTLHTTQQQDTDGSGQKGDSGKVWCPVIYFNHKCFSGPFLSKGRLAELPRHVGPGPVSLVMKEVLSLLINVAYKSSQVLRELQLQGKANTNMQQQVLKAKFKGKSYRAVVEIVRRGDQVEEFCRQICNKLECCPFLFGPRFVGDSCPQSCYNLTKTRYTPSLLKKLKKVGLSHSKMQMNAVHRRGPGRRRKRYRWHLLARTVPPAAGGQTSGDPAPTVPPKPRKKYEKYVPPKSEIVTRGAKLPNFSLQMKRHWGLRNTYGFGSSSYATRKVGRPTIRMLIEKQQAQATAPNPPNKTLPEKAAAKAIPPPDTIQLASNPLNWTVEEVVSYIKSTDCAALARVLQEQDIDGQALLMLTLPAAQEFLELKLGPSIRLCHLIERVKLAFYIQYAN